MVICVLLYDASNPLERVHIINSHILFAYNSCIIFKNLMFTLYSYTWNFAISFSSFFLRLNLLSCILFHKRPQINNKAKTQNTKLARGWRELRLLWKRGQQAPAPRTPGLPPPTLPADRWPLTAHGMNKAPLLPRLKTLNCLPNHIGLTPKHWEEGSSPRSRGPRLPGLPPKQSAARRSVRTPSPVLNVPVLIFPTILKVFSKK